MRALPAIKNNCPQMKNVHINYCVHAKGTEEAKILLSG